MFEFLRQANHIDSLNFTNMQQSENLKLHLFVVDKFDSENHYKQKLNKKFDKLLRIETE